MCQEAAFNDLNQAGIVALMGHALCIAFGSLEGELTDQDRNPRLLLGDGAARRVSAGRRGSAYSLPVR